MKNTKQLIGEILTKENIISLEELKEALRRQEQTGKPLAQQLIDLGYITSEDMCKALSIQLGIPVVQLQNIDIDRSIFDKFNPEFYKLHRVLPFKLEGKILKLAMVNPLDTQTPGEFSCMFDCQIAIYLCSEDDFNETYEKYLGKGKETVQSVIDEITDSEVKYFASNSGEQDDASELEDNANQAPVIKIVNLIFSEAIKEGASDIHIEPYEVNIKVKYRIDGILYENIQPPKNFAAAIVSRIKIMAGLNIAEKRLPQDGRIKAVVAGRNVDLRVSILPTIHGESVVIRILDKGSVELSIEEIGFSKETLKQYIKLIENPNGIILVTGPTGSGKTTTLYASITRLNKGEKKIITIEDPIEYQLENVNQIQARPQIGFSFANGLRAILRHDPDIIMVGEIRDKETAETAIQAALTGHLVFSTLHTNDAASTITRLLDMGVEHYLVTSTVRGILAQRLVRKICDECKEAYQASIQEKEAFGMWDNSNLILYRGSGCPACKHIGYKGRTSIYELLLLDDNLVKMIMNGTDSNIIKDYATRQGMMTLRESGLQKVKEGITTLAEVMRMS